MKRAVIAVFFVIAGFSVISANFRENEKPLAGLNIDTAYALNEHGFSIKESFPDITFPAAYGIVDGLQVGTRLVPWILPVMAPNGAVKWNLMPEKGSLPAFSIGGMIAGAGIKNFEIKNDAGVVTDKIDRVDLLYFNVTGYITKKIGDFYASGSFTYNRLNVTLADRGSDPDALNRDFMDTLHYYTGKEDPLGMSNIALSVIWQCLPNLRAVLEGMLLVEEPFAYYAATGIVWAIGDFFRLEAGFGGVKIGNFAGFPHLSAGARF